MRILELRVSAELRLWWQDGAPLDVERWFNAIGAVPPGGGAIERCDIYLKEGDQSEIGVKLRSAGQAGARLEVKTLVAQLGERQPFGPVEIWVKAESAALKLDGAPRVVTHKLRKMRKYSAFEGGVHEVQLGPDEAPVRGERPLEGCNVEFTQVRVEGKPGKWWTLGFEAFGRLQAVEDILHACVTETEAGGPFPNVEQAVFGSYPGWLSRL